VSSVVQSDANSKYARILDVQRLLLRKLWAGEIQFIVCERSAQVRVYGRIGSSGYSEQRAFLARLKDAVKVPVIPSKQRSSQSRWICVIGISSRQKMVLARVYGGDARASEIFPQWDRQPETR